MTDIVELFSGRDPGRPFDPSGELARLVTAEPVKPMAYPRGETGWLVTSHTGVRTVLSDPRFTARAELVNIPMARAVVEPQPAPPGMFIQNDPPEHTRYRHLLTGEFTVRRMRRLTERIEQLTTEYLDGMERREAPVDLVEAFAYPIPAQVIGELLGVAADDRAVFQTMVEDLVAAEDPERVQSGMARITEFMTGLVTAKRSRPTDDLLSGLAGNPELTDAELGNIAFMLLGAGVGTTANMLSLGVFALLQHPRQLAAWRDDPELTNNAVEELLRYLSIAPGTIRAALEDVEIDGVLIRKGESVTASISAGNRDAAHFDDPDELDLQRRTGGHLAFGHGVHQCLGQQLARVEMRVAFPALFQRFPSLRLAVEPEDVPLTTDNSLIGARRLPVVWD